MVGQPLQSGIETTDIDVGTAAKGSNLFAIAKQSITDCLLLNLQSGCECFGQQQEMANV